MGERIEGGDKTGTLPKANTIRERAQILAENIKWADKFSDEFLHSYLPNLRSPQKFILEQRSKVLSESVSELPELVVKLGNARARLARIEKDLDSGQYDTAEKANDEFISALAYAQEYQRRRKEKSENQLQP